MTRDVRGGRRKRPSRGQGEERESGGGTALPCPSVVPRACVGGGGGAAKVELQAREESVWHHAPTDKRRGRCLQRQTRGVDQARRNHQAQGLGEGVAALGKTGAWARADTPPLPHTMDVGMAALLVLVAGGDKRRDPNPTSRQRRGHHHHGQRLATPGVACMHKAKRGQGLHPSNQKVHQKQEIKEVRTGRGGSSIRGN